MLLKDYIADSRFTWIFILHPVRLSCTIALIYNVGPKRGFDIPYTCNCRVKYQAIVKSCMIPKKALDIFKTNTKQRLTM